MRDAATGTSRGFGFVTFASSFMTEAALDKAPFEICGAKVQPKRATPDKPRYKQTNTEFDTTLDKACEGKRSIFIGEYFINKKSCCLNEFFFFSSRRTFFLFVKHHSFK